MLNGSLNTDRLACIHEIVKFCHIVFLPYVDFAARNKQAAALVAFLISPSSVHAKCLIVSDFKFDKVKMCFRRVKDFF